jgi:hypothetical protein
VIRIFTGGLLIIALLIPTIASRFKASAKHSEGGF